MRRVKSCLALEASRKANRSRMHHCATRKTCRYQRMQRAISGARFFPIAPIFARERFYGCIWRAVTLFYPFNDPIITLRTVAKDF